MRWRRRRCIISTTGVASTTGACSLTGVDVVNMRKVDELPCPLPPFSVTIVVFSTSILFSSLSLFLLSAAAFSAAYSYQFS